MDHLSMRMKPMEVEKNRIEIGPVRQKRDMKKKRKKRSYFYVNPLYADIVKTGGRPPQPPLRRVPFWETSSAPL